MPWVTKQFGVDFNSGGGALTLEPEEVGSDNETGFHTKTHDDGWTITGAVVEDWAYWVNDFVATHPTLGIVRGNFEESVEASSEEAFRDFYEKHPPQAWDYADI